MTHVKTKQKFIFILCPPSSGSTLLQKIISTSANISAFNVEGQALVKPILFTPDRWNPKKIIPWDIVRDTWMESWDLGKSLFLEKSPPHLIRARQLEKFFFPSYFVIMMRNPYAFCEGFKRRWGQEYSYYNIAKLWLICAWYQIANIRNLKNRIWFTYEDLTTAPDKTCKMIVDFIPQIGSLAPEKKITVFERFMNIANLNQRQISNLSAENILEINFALRYYPDFLAYFNYRYMDDIKGEVKFKNLKKYFIKIKSLSHKPEHILWHRWTKLS